MSTSRAESVDVRDASCCVSTCRHPVGKCFENALRNVRPSFPNLRLGSNVASKNVAFLCAPKDEQKMKYGLSISRRQLTPHFYKPAFSRFSQSCEPLIVVEIVGKIVKRPVCQNGVSCRRLLSIDFSMAIAQMEYSRP